MATDDQIEALSELWAVDPAYKSLYDERVAWGGEEAARRKLAIVSICRTAMPHLERTLRLVDALATRWRTAAWYIYENDSADDTAAVLDAYAAPRPLVVVEHDKTGEADERGFGTERTIRLARCRARCQRWVRDNAGDADYVIVLDADPHGGFVVDGVLNSVGWMLQYRGEVCRRPVGAMASHSLFVRSEGTDEQGQPRLGIGAYDAWAARMSWWEDTRRHSWFHLLMPPIGSRPIPFNSAFGGLCVYRREAFLSGVYAGGDCEHVAFHKAMHAEGYQLYLNPGSRYIAILP